MNDVIKLVVGVWWLSSYTKQMKKSELLIGSSAEFDDVAISEPRKRMPKMLLLDIPPSVRDSKIIKGI